MVRSFVLGCALLGWGSTASLAAAVPDFYLHVDSVDWVVRDLGQVTSKWKDLGFPVVELGEVTLAESSDSGLSESRIRLAEGNLSGFRVVWVEPVSGDNSFSRFLSERGEGVVSLNHLAPDRVAADREVERLSRLGVNAPVDATYSAGGYTRRALRLDTASGGRLGLALILCSNRPTLPPSDPPISFTRSQYAFVVREFGPVSDYWAAFGLPALEITHGALGELRYRGQPGQFDQRLGWQRHGDVTYEWIEPLKGPTVYEDALKAHGEGFHHFAFNVDDMDAAIAYFGEKGYQVSQSGTWGTKGQPGSGRFAYIDTDAIGGITIELLWSHTGR